MKAKTKSKCDNCTRDLIHDNEVYSCRHNCTYCPECAKELNDICPNCMGKLVKRIKSKKGIRN